MKKRFIKFIVFFCALFMNQSMIFALPQPTPVNVHIQRSPMEKVVIRLRQQNIQIQRDLRAGKLTKDQAKSLKAQVETIRKQEITFLKQNGTKTLTDAQVVQLNGQLNALSKSIPIR